MRPALSLAATLLAASIALPAGDAVARDAASGAARTTCHASPDATFLASPRAPSAGGRLRVLVVTPAARGATLTIEDADGRPLAHSDDRHGLTPSWWTVETVVPTAGVYRARLTPSSDGDADACETISIGRDAPRRAAAGGAWPIERAWNRGAELLYSAWIGRLFDDPLEAEPSWQHLEPFLSDPARNFLHDHLRLGEDAPGRLRLEPDCADLPFFLRAYFAWKLGLPFGYSDCTRGGGGKPPRCVKWHSSREPAGGGDEVARVGEFLSHDVGWTIHSGSARTLGNDERGDLYPTRFAPEAIRPGTVYADPYGHTLVVVQRLPQTAERGGILLAVDAQPDGTVARKRYWRGNFLFAVDPALGGAGFKHFRPVVTDGRAWRPLDNREIAADHDYGDFSLEQYAGDADDFYDRMDDLLSPTPMDPTRALRETIQALEEQVRTRVNSVANGETYVAAHPGTIAIPSGAAIFETSGAWEDYATPSRDLRLLIAIDVVRGFPVRVARRPQRYAMPKDATAATVRDELERVIREETAARKFTYQRSDGSEATLTLADLLGRADGLEVAYNPNDCVEVRWGAPPSSNEASTCRRHAPADQVARMEEYRVWFHERRRPPRE